jgi:hypothetical protein
MIFVDEPNDNVTENFAFRNVNKEVMYVNADTRCTTIDIYDGEGNSKSYLHYEDIPKLILALQAAYDFKFKGEA